jgi:hypothetical protein
MSTLGCLSLRGSMYKKLILVLNLTLLSNVTFAGDLKPFSSDGCSAFPDGNFKYNELWLECCTAHDYTYWKGGTYSNRLEADIALKQCVSTVGQKEIALVMLAGVRVGGSPYLPTNFRWGYGWPYPKFYGSLTNAELEEVKKLNPRQ